MQKSRLTRLEEQARRVAQLDQAIHMLEVYGDRGAGAELLEVWRRSGEGWKCERADQTPQAPAE